MIKLAEREEEIKLFKKSQIDSVYLYERFKKSISYNVSGCGYRISFYRSNQKQKMRFEIGKSNIGYVIIQENEYIALYEETRKNNLFEKIKFYLHTRAQNFKTPKGQKQ